MDRSPGGRGAYQSDTSTQSSGSSTLRKGWLCLIASMKLARPTYTQLTVTAHCGHLPLQSIPSEQSHAFLGLEGRSRGGVRRPIAAAQGQIDGGGRQGRWGSAAGVRVGAAACTAERGAASSAVVLAAALGWHTPLYVASMPAPRAAKAVAREPVSVDGGVER